MNLEENKLETILKKTDSDSDNSKEEIARYFKGSENLLSEFEKLDFTPMNSHYYVRFFDLISKYNVSIEESDFEKLLIKYIIKMSHFSRKIISVPYIDQFSSPIFDIKEEGGALYYNCYDLDGLSSLAPLMKNKKLVKKHEDSFFNVCTDPIGGLSFIKTISFKGDKEVIYLPKKLDTEILNTIFGNFVCLAKCMESSNLEFFPTNNNLLILEILKFITYTNDYNIKDMTRLNARKSHDSLLSIIEKNTDIPDESKILLMFSEKQNLSHFFIFENKLDEFIKKQQEIFDNQVLSGFTGTETIENKFIIEYDKDFFNETDIDNVFFELKRFFYNIHNEKTSLFSPFKENDRGIVDWLTRPKNNEYPINISYRITNDIFLMGLEKFDSCLKYDYSLSKVVEYFFKNKLNNYGITGFQISIKASPESYFESCLSLFTMFEHVLKQWVYFTEHNEVNHELIAFSSAPLAPLEEIKDLKGEYLFVEPEIAYLNFHLNKKSGFSNALELRNKYSHGSYWIENDEMHKYNYYQLLKIMFFIIFKIEGSIA